MDHEQSGDAGKAVSAVKAELKDDGAKLAETAKDRAQSVAKENMSKASGTASSAASALDKAAEELQQDSNAPDWMASAFKQIATSVNELASNLDGKEPNQIIHDVSKFAKNSPTAFLAASAAAGFAAARVLRSGAESRLLSSTGKGSSNPNSSPDEISRYRAAPQVPVATTDNTERSA